MKIWLMCFGLLFVGAELFQWAIQLKIGQFSGGWLILGGMGLAAASNAAHFPQRSAIQSEPASSPPPKAAASVSKADDPGNTKRSPTRSEGDSISFEVRSPHR